MRNNCYSGWRKLELSSTLCNLWSDLFCKRLPVARCVVGLNVSCHLSRRFRDDCGTSCGTDCTVYQDLVMDASVYLVSYDGLRVKITTHETVSLSLYLRFHCVKKNKKISSRSCPCFLGCFHSALSWSVSFVPHQYSNFKILVCSSAPPSPMSTPDHPNDMAVRSQAEMA